MRVALVNLKGGSAKTTSSLFVAAELNKRGRTLLIDCDPQGSALAWSSMAELPFPVVALPVEDLYKRIDALAVGYEHVVIDTPPGDEKIVRGVLRAVDTALLPIGTSLIEIDRLKPTIRLMAEVEDLNEFDVFILLTRVKRRTNSARAAREYLSGSLELPVLETDLPDWQRYALAFGDVPDDSEEYANVVRELFDEELVHAASDEEVVADSSTDASAATPEPHELAEGEAAPAVNLDGHERLDFATQGRAGLEQAVPLPQAPLAVPAPVAPNTHAMPSALEQEEGGDVDPSDVNEELDELQAELDEETLEEVGPSDTPLPADAEVPFGPDPTGAEMTAVLDAIPGARERVAVGVAQAARGETLSLEEFAADAPAPHQARDLRCVPYHFWQVDYEQGELGQDGVQRYLHHCINCELEVMAADVDAASVVADKIEALTQSGATAEASNGGA
jgi:chromosome partitioning protein